MTDRFKSKPFYSLLSSICLLAALSAAGPGSRASERVTEVSFLLYTDSLGRLFGPLGQQDVSSFYTAVARERHNSIKSGRKVFVFDGGNGRPSSLSSWGRPYALATHIIGPDVQFPGPADLSLPPADLKNILRWGNWPIVSTDVTLKPAYRFMYPRMAERSRVLDRRGLRIGIISVWSDEFKSDSLHWQKEKAASALQAGIDYLAKKQVNLVVLHYRGNDDHRLHTLIRQNKRIGLVLLSQPDAAYDIHKPGNQSAPAAGSIAGSQANIGVRYGVPVVPMARGFGHLGRLQFELDGRRPVKLHLHDIPVNRSLDVEFPGRYTRSDPGMNRFLAVFEQSTWDKPLYFGRLGLPSAVGQCKSPGGQLLSLGLASLDGADAGLVVSDAIADDRLIQPVTVRNLAGLYPHYDLLWEVRLSGAQLYGYLDAVVQRAATTGKCLYIAGADLLIKGGGRPVIQLDNHPRYVRALHRLQIAGGQVDLLKEYRIVVPTSLLRGSFGYPSLEHMASRTSLWKTPLQAVVDYVKKPGWEKPLLKGYNQVQHFSQAP